MPNRKYPILYSFRRCPYAMRARLGLTIANIKVELREVVLRNKPEHMLELSPKGTVPVLWLQDGTVIDESLNIAKWTLAQNDPLKLLEPENASVQNMHALIAENDGPFKHHLDRTKYGTRYPGENPQDHRQQASAFLQTLNTRLTGQTHLCGNRHSLADITITPFVRQFANIDRDWFNNQPWPHLIEWLDNFLASEVFLSIMEKYSPWKEGDPTTFFPQTEPATTP